MLTCPGLCSAKPTDAWGSTKFLTDLIGLEQCPITHVLGHRTSEYRLFHESRTLIVAFGIHEAFPNAIFLYAKEPEGH
jgi:hypothetical protein